MLGEPLIVTLTFVRSGNTYFSESLEPAAYGSTNRRRMAFSELLWASTLMLILVSLCFFQGHHFGMSHVVIDELFAAGVNAVRLVCQSLASDHFVLELDVGQLVFQLSCVRARVTFWTRKLLACPPERTMSKRSASEPGTRTSFWFN